MIRCITIVLLLLALAAASRASEPCVDLSNHDMASLLAFEFEANTTLAGTSAGVLAPGREYAIGEVRVVRQPIFDATNPAEDRWLYRAANAAHSDTRERVIRQIILFSEGARAKLSELIESERLLRQKPYFYDARILPRRLCGDRLDVDVVTRDVWSLYPRLDATSAGGDEEYGIGLTDVNLLGTGREVSAGYTSDEDRKGVDVSYYDPNVAGSRVALTAFVADLDDGSQQLLDIRRPFFALGTPFALGGRMDIGDREERLYFRNDEIAEFERDYEQYSISGGRALGRHKGNVRRVLAGYRYERHSFAPVLGSVPPSPLPEDRTFGYPYVGFERIEDEFEVATNVDRIERTEDLYLGLRLWGELGYSHHAFGGDGSERAVLRLGFQDGVRGSARRLYTYGANVRSYWNFDTDEEEELIARAYLAYRRQQSDRFSFAGTLDYVYTSNLFADQQLLLGGDTGLRGYPSRYQVGDRRFLLSLEERYFSDLYVLRLVRVGYAAFFDVGRAWFPSDPDDDDYGMLANVGLGLRLESTRTRRDRIFHIDMGVPLVDGPRVDAVQFSFTVKTQL